MQKILVSVGNPLKSDDNIANIVIKKVRFDGKKICAGPNPENFLHILKDAEFVIFLDAVDWGGRVGDVKFFRIEDVHTIFSSTHSIPIDLIARLLNKKIVIIGIQPYNIGYGIGISKELKKQLKGIVSKTERILDKICKDLI